MRLLMFSCLADSYVHRRVKEACLKMGIKFSFFCYSDLVFQLRKGKVQIKVGEENLPPFDWVVLRTPRKENLDFTPQRDILVDFFFTQKKILLNGESFQRFPGYNNKLLQQYYLAQEGLPNLRTFNFGHLSQAAGSLSFPLIVKRDEGSSGREVFKIKNQSQWEKFFTERPLAQRFLFQPFLSAGEDFRILVLGKKALGAMRRVAPKGSFITNFSQGGQVEATKLTPKLEKLALAASRVLKGDFVGVDIMEGENNELFILEVNRSPGFEGFEKATGVDVAGQIVDYLKKKSR